MAVSSRDRTALVLYGSETGNAQDVAEELGKLCERLRFETRVAELDSITLVCLWLPQISGCWLTPRRETYYDPAYAYL